MSAGPSSCNRNEHLICHGGLTELPLETFTNILRFVGTKYLKYRLTVCRLWYDVAQALILEDIALNQDLLNRFPPQEEHMKQLVKDNIRCLSITLAGFPYRWGDPDYGDWLAWCQDLNQRMVGIADYMSSFKKLFTFELNAFTDLDLSCHERPRREYLAASSAKAIMTSLSHTRITCLTVDTYGTALSNVGLVIKDHICPLLIEDFPHLRFLKLRMRHICPQIFDLTKRKSHNALATVIINLSLLETERAPSTGFARHCGRDTSLGGWDLHAAMVKAASSARELLPAIKRLRVLCHRLPSLELIAEDCINNKFIIIPTDDWVHEGESEIVDNEPDDNDLFNDSESLDSSDQGQ